MSLKKVLARIWQKSLNDRKPLRPLTRSRAYHRDRLAFLRASFERLEDRAMLSTITANLTVDNGYWLYYGEADGSRLVQVGSDPPDRTAWQWSEEYTFHAPADNYIYV